MTAAGDHAVGEQREDHRGEGDPAAENGRPEVRDRLLVPVGSFSILTLPGDNDTWSVTLFGSMGDQPLKKPRSYLRKHCLVRAPMIGRRSMQSIVDCLCWASTLAIAPIYFARTETVEPSR